MTSQQFGVVFPLRDGWEGLRPLWEELRGVWMKTGKGSSVVFADERSTYGGGGVLVYLARQDFRVRALLLGPESGHDHGVGAK